MTGHRHVFVAHFHFAMLAPSQAPRTEIAALDRFRCCILESRARRPGTGESVRTAHRHLIAPQLCTLYHLAGGDQLPIARQPNRI